MYLPTVDDRVGGSHALQRRRWIGRTLAHAFARMHIEGLDNVPDRGPVVLAMNHRAFVDGPLVFGFTPRPVTCLVKVEAFTPGWGPVLRSAGQVPIDRARVDVAPVRQCLQILNAGGVVGIFPEGARGDGLVARIKDGAAYLALRTGATIVPVAFHGTDRLGRGLHRPEVAVVFGPPMPVEQVDPHRPLNRRVTAEEAERLRIALAGHVRASSPLGRGAQQ